jgi:predicted CoA-binding protein
MTPADPRHVVVLGASPKAHRYSYQAVTLLHDTGHRVTPVHPRAESVAGIPAVPGLAAVARPVHTVTLYVGPAHLEPLLSDLLQLAPERVIFNPGSESATAQRQLSAAGIEWLEACTLVMIRIGTF